MSFATDQTRWQALCNRTPAAHASFIYGVITTRIFCRPTCPARLARRANVVFFDAAGDAVRAGFRPCKRCKPDSATPERRNEEVVQRACGIIRDRNGAVTPAEAAKLVGLSYRYFHGIFKEVTGVTPAHFAKQCRDEHLGDAAASAGLTLSSATTSIQMKETPTASEELSRDSSLQGVKGSYQELLPEDLSLEKDLDSIWREMCEDDSFGPQILADDALLDGVDWNRWLSGACQTNDIGILDSEWIL